MNYLNENIDSLNKKLQDGEITAEDLAKETVKNIKETDKKINAWITVDEEAKPAENLDFNKNKLAGIPIAIKDNIITNGMKTTAASHILYNYMPVYDATVISKLKKAQATFVGKTNMDEFAMGSSTEHSYYGEIHGTWIKFLVVHPVVLQLQLRAVKLLQLLDQILVVLFVNQLPLTVFLVLSQPTVEYHVGDLSLLVLHWIKLV